MDSVQIFKYIQIPEFFFGTLKNMMYLNLSYTYLFQGMLMHLFQGRLVLVSAICRG